MKKEKQTLQQKLAMRKIKQPPMVIYPLLARVWKLLFFKKLGVKVDYRIDVKQYKGPYIVVSNHASRLDYIYTGIAFLPHRLNFVAGYNEFFRSHLAWIFHLLQVIPKRNFVPDIHTIKSMSRVLDRGGRVIVFPEGMSSISGGNQPCAIGSGKMLKHFGVPVLSVKISGGYLTSTKYCLDERPGKVQVVIDRLFTPEQLRDLSADEVQDRLDAAIANDDYAWNKIIRARYEGKGRMADKLHTLLYWCPRCKREFTMLGEGDTIICTCCGNGARLNEYYDLIPFDETCVIPDTPKAWLDLERANIRSELQQPGFLMREKIKLGVLPQYKLLAKQATSEIAGEGELSLNRGGFYFEGVKGGAPFKFFIPSDQLPTFGMCTDVSRFYTFLDNEFLEFYPDRESTEKWILAVEENHRLSGGKWRDFADA